MSASTAVLEESVLTLEISSVIQSRYPVKLVLHALLVLRHSMSTSAQQVATLT